VIQGYPTNGHHQFPIVLKMPKCHYVRQAGFATLFEDPMDVVAGILHILIGQQLK
jgi:hypothetical protein